MSNIDHYNAIIAMVNQLDDEGLKRVYALIQRIFLRHGAKGKGALKEYAQRKEQISAIFQL